MKSSRNTSTANWERWRPAGRRLGGRQDAGAPRYGTRSAGEGSRLAESKGAHRITGKKRSEKASQSELVGLHSACLIVLPKILIIEDEPAIADTLLYALKTDGFEPFWCATGAAGLGALAQQEFALVILDVGLPDGNGFDFCRAIRALSNVPIFFLTARSSEIDRVVGLEIGGDDYLVKPFSPRELTARVKAILRRAPLRSSGDSIPGTPGSAGTRAAATPAAPPTSHPTGAAPPPVFQVDGERCRIVFRGQALDLTRYEFRLLRALLAQPGRVFSREQLMNAAWEEPGASLDRTVDAHIKLLRSKLRAVDPASEYIQTHRGMGYSLREH
jgi:two-component system, OmpR family, catabolic regulation response regulator CreB